MWGRRAAVFATSLVLALIVGMVPGMAFADQASGEKLAVGTQASSISLTAPTKSDVCIVGQPVTAKAYSNLYLFQYGYAVSNYLTFRVTQGGKVIYYGSDWFNSAGSTVSVTFTPKQAGACKIEVSGIGFSEKSKDSFEAADSITIKVKKASAFKKVEAELYADRIAKNQVQLSWEPKGTGAEIYRATTSNGTYKLVKTMKTSKGNSFVDKVKKNKNYFYKLRYYLKSGKNTYKSKFSTSQWKFAKAPSKPTITKAAKLGKKKVQLKWKVAKDCGHFTIYRSLKKKGGFEVIAYVSGDQFCYVDKSVQSGKRYYYKVEADIYYDWNGTIKGKKSGVKAVKV